MISRHSISSIADSLISYVSHDALEDLRTEDPRTAVDLYFGPIRFQELPRAGLLSGNCSIDGYYDPFIDNSNPWIFYAADVYEARVRFTILHELGHHLFATVAAKLLDDLDQFAGSFDGGAILAEEAVCHCFAGRLLVPSELIRDVIGPDRVTPKHVKAIHEKGLASWEAVAVRVAESMLEPGAVVLMRDAARISFCASSPRLGRLWWPRGSRVDQKGPLARSLATRQTAHPETYRFEMAYSQAMFCDTLPIHRGLAIGVLCDKPSNGGLSIIDQPDPLWRSRAEFCEWHPGVEREVGWCYKCKGRRCPECGRCGCIHPAKNSLCPQCGLQKPFRKGASMCHDCEMDFL